MCIQMVSNDCKKLQLVNKPVVVGTCLYKGKESLHLNMRMSEI